MPLEPTYRVVSPGTSPGTATIQTRPTPGGGQVVRVSIVTGDRTSAAVTILDESGQILRARTEQTDRPTHEAFREGMGFKVRDAGGQGELKLDQPLLTPLDFVGWLGTRLPDRPGRYRFRLIAAQASGIPRLDRVVVEVLPDPPPPPTPKPAPGKKPKAPVRPTPPPPPPPRRIRVTIVDSRDRSSRTGELRLDRLTGAVLQVGPPLTDLDFSLDRAPRGGALLYWRNGAVTRRDSAPDGTLLRLVVDGRQILGAATVDATGNPLHIENKGLGRPMRAAVAGDRVVWELTPAPSATVMIDASRAWFPTHLVVTELWEARGPFADMVVGEKREGSLLLFSDGDKDDAFALERLADEAMRRRYRLTYGSSTLELTTDGKRLVHLSSDRGLEMTRIGG